MSSTRYSEETGTFTVWALGLCLVLFLISGISIDLWRAYDARRTLHEIADTAARAGANEINIYQRQIYGRIILDAPLASNTSRKSINANTSLHSIDLTSHVISTDTTKNEVTVELHSSYSFFLLGMMPGGSNADLSVKASAHPFED